jgi:biotin operon repressor
MSNINRPLTETQHKVLTMIKGRPKNHPITGHELMTFLDIRDKDGKEGANLRAVVNALRDKGYPVCAGGRRYYYPQTPDELQEYVDSFQNRIDQQQQACDNLKEKLINWRGVLVAGKDTNNRQDNFGF